MYSEPNQFRLGGRENILMVLGLVAIGLVGLIVGSQGAVALLVFGLVAIGVLILVHPLVGVLLLVGSIPLQTLLVFGEGVTATRLLGVVVSGAWLLQKLLRGESWTRLISSRLVLVSLAFLALVLLSAQWAQYPQVAIKGFYQLGQLLVLCIIVIDLFDSWERCSILAKALVIGGLIAAALTIQQFFFGGMRRAGEDVAGGVNATAVLLVTLIPFGFYLLRSQRARIWQVVGVGFVTLAVLAIMVTFSRMNMILLPPLLIALFWQTVQGGKGRAGLLALTAAGAVVAFYIVPWESVAKRGSTIVPYIQSTLGAKTPAEQAASGRGYHLRVGLAIAQDHPILGVGYGNYGRLFISEYQYIVSGAGKEYETPRSPHSSHVGILADLGIVGLTAWVALLAVALLAVARAWRLTSRAKRSPPHIFVQAVAYAVLLHVFAYGFYMPNQREKIFWVVLALCPVVERLASSLVSQARDLSQSASMERVLAEAGSEVR